MRKGSIVHVREPIAKKKTKKEKEHFMLGILIAMI